MSGWLVVGLLVVGQRRKRKVFQGKGKDFPSTDVLIVLL
jgi:hypothetical protein